MKAERKIITSHDNPPIPSRNYDWSAYREDYDEGDLIGHGATEQEAIEDLIERENDLVEERLTVASVIKKYSLTDYIKEEDIARAIELKYGLRTQGITIEEDIEYEELKSKIDVYI